MLYSAQYGSGKEQRDMGYIHIADAQQSLNCSMHFKSGMKQIFPALSIETSKDGSPNLLYKLLVVFLLGNDVESCCMSPDFDTLLDFHTFHNQQVHQQERCIKSEPD